MKRISVSLRSCSAVTVPKYAQGARPSLVREVVVDGEVGEVEVDVAHARVLPVDDSDPAAVVDEVRQQVVVAGALGDRAARTLDEPGCLPRALEGCRQGDLARGRRGGVRLDDAERVEARRDRRPAVWTARSACATRRSGSGLAAPPAPRPRLEVARDQQALRLDERDHSPARRRRLPRRATPALGAPVDAEQLGVLAADPEHVGGAVDGDLEVVVRDPTAEHLTAAPRPGQMRSTISSTPDIRADPRAGARARPSRRQRTSRRAAAPAATPRSRRQRRRRAARRARACGRRRRSA